MTKADLTWCGEPVLIDQEVFRRCHGVSDTPWGHLGVCPAVESDVALVSIHAGDAVSYTYYIAVGKTGVLHSFLQGSEARSYALFDERQTALDPSSSLTVTLSGQKPLSSNQKLLHVQWNGKALPYELPVHSTTTGANAYAAEDSTAVLLFVNHSKNQEDLWLINSESPPTLFQCRN